MLEHDAVGLNEELDFKFFSGVYYLYLREKGYEFLKPNSGIMSIYVGEGMIQIDDEGKKFSHYHAIKKMEELGLVDKIIKGCS